MRVHVTADYDHDDGPLTVAFLADTEVTTKRAWGEALVAAGKGEEIQPPTRDEDAGSR